jgi:indole-3-glycerol phosphate synthase
MSGFLTRILETKRQEVERLRNQPQPDLSQLPPCRGFARAIAEQAGLAVVAEVKRASPSKGLIATHFDPVATARTYERAGACAVSVLTDHTWFQGSLEHLRAVKAAVRLPVLRKDFLIDELQIIEARAAGADAVLLIAAALEADRLAELAAYARSLGLDVLVEVHDVRELEAALAASPSVLGVNNRNLHTFEVNLETTREVLRHVPADVLIIAESGIHSAEDARYMERCGARGILVGESLMREQTEAGIAGKIAAFRGVEGRVAESGGAR